MRVDAVGCTTGDEVGFSEGFSDGFSEGFSGAGFVLVTLTTVE